MENIYLENVSGGRSPRLRRSVEVGMTSLQNGGGVDVAGKLSGFNSVRSA